MTAGQRVRYRVPQNEIERDLVMIVLESHDDAIPFAKTTTRWERPLGNGSLHPVETVATCELVAV